ncbi:MAG: hypothetical protein IKU06_11330 [Lachnospiraceae bacterium]|nr:hypothetical protein [Lachnospiraceae bacterium]
MFRGKKRDPLLECIQKELLLFCKSKSMLFFGIAWGILLLLFCISVSSSSLIGNALTTSGWVTQSLLTGGMTIGILRVSVERKEHCEELFLATSNSWINKIVAKIIVIIVVGILILFTGVISVFGIFIIRNAVLLYYLSTLAYIFLYWIIPFYIAGFIGTALGLIVRTKIVYLLMAILSFIIGPCISLAVEPFMLSRRGTLYEYYVMFNVGQLDPNGTISESFGYCLNIELWIMRLCVLFGVLMLLVGVAQTILRTNSSKRLVSVFLAIVLFVIGFTGTNKILKIQFERYRQSELIEYYKDNPEPVFGESEENPSSMYEIEGYKITIDDGLKLEISSLIEIYIKEDCSKLVFTLFHGFGVDSCQIDGKEYDYEVMGDALIIPIDSNIWGHRKLNLTYKGLPPGNLYKASDKWILPGMFAWIPIEYIGKAMENEMDSLALFSYPDKKNTVPITVEYLGSNKVHCSLEEKTSNYWEGNSTGITLVSGWFEEIDIDGISMIYPSLYPENQKQALNLMKKLQEICPFISVDLLNEPFSFDLDKIFIIPSILYTNIDTGMYFFGDHVVVCIYYDRGGYLIEKMDGIDTIAGLVRTSGWADTDKDMIMIFEYAYIKRLYDMGVYKSTEIPSLERLVYSLAEYERNYAASDLGSKILSYLNSTSYNEQMYFFRDYLKLINTGEANVENIYTLFEK